MQYPPVDLLARDSGTRDGLHQDLFRMLRSKPRHRAGQDITEHSAAVLESQRLALNRIDQRGRLAPFNSTLSRRPMAGENGGTGAVTEQAGADQDAGIIIQIHRSTAHFDANRQYMVTLPRLQKRVRELPVGKRTGAPLSH